MLYNYLYPLADQFSALNVFRYLTFRTGGAVMTALIISFLLGPRLIDMLRARQGGGQSVATVRRVISSPKKARRPWVA